MSPNEPLVGLPDDAMEQLLHELDGWAPTDLDLDHGGDLCNGVEFWQRVRAWYDRNCDLAARVRAEAVADERQRVASEVEGEFRRRIQARVDQNRTDGYPQTADALVAGAGYLLEVLREWAAGSTQGGAHDDDFWGDSGPECGWLQQPGDARYGCSLPAGHSGKCKAAE